MSKLGIILLVAAVSGVAGYEIGERQEVAPSPASVQREAAPIVVPEQSNVQEMSPLEFLEMESPSMSQSYGTVCTTSRGNCTVPRQPLNSVCQCGSTVGRVTR